MNFNTHELKLEREIKKINGEFLDVRVSEQRSGCKKSLHEKIKLESEIYSLSNLFKCFERPWIDAHTAVFNEKPDVILYLNNEQKISLELTSISVESCFIFDNNSKEKYFKEQANIKHLFEMNSKEFLCFGVKYKTHMPHFDLYNELIKSIKQKSDKIRGYTVNDFIQHWLLIYRPYNCSSGWDNYLFIDLEEKIQKGEFSLENFHRVIIMHEDYALLSATRSSEKNNIHAVFIDKQNNQFSPLKKHQSLIERCNKN